MNYSKHDAVFTSVWAVLHHISCVIFIPSVNNFDIEKSKLGVSLNFYSKTAKSLTFELKLPKRQGYPKKIGKLCLFVFSWTQVHVGPVWGRFPLWVKKCYGQTDRRKNPIVLFNVLKNNYDVYFWWNIKFSDE